MESHGVGADSFRLRKSPANLIQNPALGLIGTDAKSHGVGANWS